MLSVFALPRDFKLRQRGRMWRRNAKARSDAPFILTDCILRSLYGLMREWCASRIIYKITKRALYAWNLDSEVCLFAFHDFLLSSSLFFPVNLFEILLGFKPLALSLSLTHLVSWLQQGLKRLQFISTHSGWRPHLVAAGNSISLPHTDEWVTTFRAPVNMCLLW